MKIKHFIEEKMLIVEITEDLDHHESEKIRRRVDYEIQRLLPKRVIFDFNRVVFMDSAGIGLIIGRYKAVSSYGGELQLINVGKKVKRIFEMSGLLKMIRIIDSYKNEKITN